VYKFTSVHVMQVTQIKHPTRCNNQS